MPAVEAFLDTNILLYLLSSDDAKANRAEALIAAGGVISVQVLNEFASVGLRKLSLTVVEVREILTTIRSACLVSAIDLATHDLGLDLAERHQLAVYEAMIVAAAIQAGCSVLYTEDLQHSQKFDSVSIRNPFLS